MKITVFGFPAFLLAVSVSIFFPHAAKAQAPRPEPRLSLRYAVSPSKPSPHGKASRVAGDSLAARPHADSLTLQVRVDLPPGWHINSETPPDSFLVATHLHAEASGMQFGKPHFPAPEMVFSQAIGEKLPLYSGSFEVGIPARGPAGAASQSLPATRVTLHYQACNDSMCLPPKDVTVEQ